MTGCHLKYDRLSHRKQKDDTMSQNEREKKKKNKKIKKEKFKKIIQKVLIIKKICGIINYLLKWR